MKTLRSLLDAIVTTLLALWAPILVAIFVLWMTTMVMEAIPE